jgi:hypothetical protein
LATKQEDSNLVRRHQEQANAHVLDAQLIVNLKDVDRTVAILVVSQSIQFVPLKEDSFTHQPEKILQ